MLTGSSRNTERLCPARGVNDATNNARLRWVGPSALNCNSIVQTSINPSINSNQHLQWLSDSRSAPLPRKPATRRHRTRASAQQDHSYATNPSDQSISLTHDDYWPAPDQSTPRRVQSSPSQSRLSSIQSLSPASTASTQPNWCQAIVLRTIFQRGFNTVFGSWMGLHGCPLLSVSVSSSFNTDPC